MARVNILTSNVDGRVREATIDGRQYLVAPMSLINPGVLNGSKGPLFYPPEEINRNVDAWNGMPITVGHPTDNGRAVSARDPKVVEKFGIGVLYNAQANGKLRAEGWFDVQKTRQVRPDILNKLLQGEKIELSTGLYTDNEPAPRGATHNGRKYDFIARNYRPDHLAILPDSKGACSIQDGCGVLVNQATRNKCKKKPADNAGTLPAKKGLQGPDEECLDENCECKQGQPCATKNQSGPSHAALRKALAQAISQRYGQTNVEEVYDKTVIYSTNWSNGPMKSDEEPRLYEISYTSDKAGVVTLSDLGATEVKRVVSYKPVQNERTASELLAIVNQDESHVGPSVFNQEEEPDMAQLTTNEREQMVTALVSNCGGFGEDDREWLDGLTDERLTVLLQNCADLKVLNERLEKLTDNAKKATKNKKPPFVEEDEEDASADEEEDWSEEDMEENKKATKNKKPTKNAADPEPEPEPKPEDEENEMTDNQWLEKAPAGVRAVVAEAMAFNQARKGELIAQIVANKRNPFAKEELDGMDIKQLQKLTALAAVEAKQPAHPLYAGAAAPVGNARNEVTDAETDILPLPVMNFSKAG